MGIENAYVKANDHNCQVQNLYKKLGFVELDKEEIWQRKN